MRLGWLVNNFSDPHLHLTPEQKREAFRITHERHLRGKLLGYTFLVVIPPLLALFWVATLVHDWVGERLGITSNGANALLIGVIVLLSWPWSAWAYGRLYSRPYRMALRDAGLRVCAGCGYALEGLAGRATCPECGEPEPADPA